MSKYVKLIDDIIVDFLKDIKSLRYQLILGGYFFNVYLFRHNASSAVQMAAIGLLTSVYGMYFISKYHQAILSKKNHFEP